MKSMDKQHRIVFGKGINDYKVVKSLAGEDYVHYEDVLFNKWHSMIRRCYSDKYQERKGTHNYKKVSVWEPWLRFSNFWLWAKDMDYAGKELDKDIIGSFLGKLNYSPDTCAFISDRLNKFLCIRGNARGDYPVGVTKHGSRYQSRCTLGSENNRAYLGNYTTPEQAHKAWQEAKLAYGRELLSEQTDERVIEGLTKILDNLEDDIHNGRITEKLV